jgi:hypothetical protein
VPRCSRARAPTSSPGTRSRWRTSPPGRSSTTSSWPGKGGQMARSAGSASSSSPRTRGTRRCASSGEMRACSSPAADRGAGRQCRPRQHHRRQGRPLALAREAPDRARLRDEPGRPPHGGGEGSRRAAAIRSPRGRDAGTHPRQAQGTDKPSSRPAPREGEAQGSPEHRRRGARSRCCCVVLSRPDNNHYRGPASLPGLVLAPRASTNVTRRSVK